MVQMSFILCKLSMDIFSAKKLVTLSSIVMRGYSDHGAFNSSGGLGLLLLDFIIKTGMGGKNIKKE